MFVFVIDGVGVPMFWPDWQEQKMRQHQNHFQTSGSSPPRSREGSLCMSKGFMSMRLKCYDFRLVIKLGVCLFDCLFGCWLSGKKDSM